MREGEGQFILTHRKLRDVEVLPEHVSQILLAAGNTDERDEVPVAGDLGIELASSNMPSPAPSL
jgi:hypothetical protein